ncbi:MAG: DUF6665 family protein [Rhizobiaceae bacterium]
MSTLRMPGMITAIANGKSPVDVIEYEMMGEKASALGRAGQRAEAALISLRSYEGEPAGRAAVLKSAADAVYAYFIQRELCGFRRHQDIIREYAIPNEVLARLGAR